jgi:hypothetical protein
LIKSKGLAGHFQALPERLSRWREVLALCEQPEGLGSAELLERLGIHYWIGSASRSGLPPQSVHLIVSDVVFECLWPEELFDILQEFRRIASPDAVMRHTISLDDQYAAYDSELTQFNLLHFSNRAWRWLNNPIVPLNRLRVGMADGSGGGCHQFSTLATWAIRTTPCRARRAIATR